MTKQPEEMPFLGHLIELRQRLLYSVLAVLVIFLLLFPFDQWLFSLLADPLLRYLPEGTNMVAIDPASPFITPLKLSLVLAIFLAMPILLYQVWGFIAPGLYQHEKRLAKPLLFSSIALFYLGVAFAYFVVFPLVFHFFISVLPHGVEMSTDIGRYLDFVLKMFFAFGIAFEVPVATVLIILTGMTSASALAQQRPYIIVGAFVVGMLLTPPDAFSQILLALPMWLLFELGLVLASVLQRERATKNPTEDTVTTLVGDDQLFRPLTPQEMDEELDAQGWHSESQNRAKEP